MTELELPWMMSCAADSFDTNWSVVTRLKGRARWTANYTSSGRRCRFNMPIAVELANQPGWSSSARPDVEELGGSGHQAIDFTWTTAPTVSGFWVTRPM
jgi:hypothetical protein